MFERKVGMSDRKQLFAIIGLVTEWLLMNWWSGTVFNTRRVLFLYPALE
jgi:hypothetical protein